MDAPVDVKGSIASRETATLQIEGVKSSAKAARISLYRGVKRAIDIGCALVLLFLFLPLFLVIAVLVATDGGPVLFRHKRVGRGGVIFPCLKFRTMVPDAEHLLAEYLRHHPEAAREWREYQKLTFDPRITTIGKALRASSLDELPQLLNVLKGEMSLVGPRPVTAEELSRYGAAAEHYKSVLPGITGLWQISGRNALSYGQRVALDIEYVKGWSPMLDIWILLKTPLAVLSRKGAR